MDFGKFALLMFLGFCATEGVVEYLAGKLLDLLNVLPKYHEWLAYLSVGVGIFFAFWYKVDVIYLWLGEAYSPVGVVLTGVLIGRGANAIHKAASLISGWVQAQYI